MRTDPCAICGSLDRTTVALVHWRVSAPGMSYEHVNRCLDHAACRARVQAKGKPWPLVETVTSRHKEGLTP